MVSGLQPSIRSFMVCTCSSVKRLLFDKWCKTIRKELRSRVKVPKSGTAVRTAASSPSDFERKSNFIHPPATELCWKNQRNKAWFGSNPLIGPGGDQWKSEENHTLCAAMVPQRTSLKLTSPAGLLLIGYFAGPGRETLCESVRRVFYGCKLRWLKAEFLKSHESLKGLCLSLLS